ncbi:replication/maintenance protein RepL [Planococcus sp. YIM B11945]|uniref:replication/maintenance protein RepL n=1 Tax=Planococcus sp. YIM B11945 TaxID=3435410 RepID=UPI003D7D5CC2
MISTKTINENLSYSMTETKAMNEWRSCFSSESPRVAELGEKFIRYFLRNATPEGVLFKTIKEITGELNMPHQTLTKILKALEDHQIIYRRNGIIGLWKE